MKEIKELKFEDLSVDQKLGMIHAAVINYIPGSEHQNEFLFDRIRNHALGAIWIPSNAPYTEGFKGFFITDAIDMMGIRAKFGEVESKGMAVEAGNDFVLTYSLDPIGDQKIINTCYEKGIITDERLDEAVKKVLEIQHKSLEMGKNMITELTDEEYKRLRNIEKNAVCAKVDQGLSTSISRDGKHLFVVMLRNEMNPADVAVDTFKSNWLFPDKIEKRILELFPNSQVHFIHQMPTARQNQLALIYATKNEDVVFLTFSETIAYVGQDEITKRVRTLMEAMQYTDKISAVVHFGDPTTLSGLPHIPRYILGDTYEGSVDACLDVLAGENEAKGKLTYDVILK